MKKIKSTIKILFTFTLIYILYQNIDVTLVMEKLQGVDLKVLLLAFILNYVGSITIQSMITKKSSSTLKVSLWELDKVNLSMRMYMMILPMAVVSALRWHRYTLLGASKTHSFILMLQNKALQMLFISFFIIISSIILHSLLLVELKGSFYLLLVSAIFMSLLMLYLIGIVVGVFNSAPFFKIMIILSIKLPSKIKNKFKRITFKFKNSLLGDHHLEATTIIQILILSLMGHTLVLFSQYYATMSIGMDITFWILAFARSFVQLLLMLPITVAGIGAREFGFISTLGLFSISSEFAVALSVILLGFQILFAVLGGLNEVFFIFHKRVVNEI